MNIYYLDASAWVKRYVLEEGTSFVQGLFTTDNLLACSTFGFIEVVATLARKWKAKEIPDTVFVRMAMEAENDWNGFAHIEMDGDVLQTAVALTKKHFLRGADAVHLSSAIFLNDKFSFEQDTMQFISADEELNTAAQQNNITVINPINSKRYIL